MFTHKAQREIASKPALLFIVMVVVLVCSGIVLAQTPQPSPDASYGGYHITGNSEFGWRWRSLDGNENKYKSDLNYGQGFRLFDSNMLFEKENGKWFDSLLLMTSGWGQDPNGHIRLNMEKTGFYKLNFSTRKVNYFNNLTNYVAINNQSQHTQDWKQTLTDIDFTLFPQSDKLRLSFGGSFSDTHGDGLWTARGYRDDFATPNVTKLTAKDFRIGAEGTLGGFNWGLSQGFRLFNDRGNYQLPLGSIGNNTTDTTIYGPFSKYYPADGHAYFTQFNVNRTFAKKFDFTGRFIYSSASSKSDIVETFLNARDNSNNYVDSDQFTINGTAKRPQSRADVGITYRITDSFRISNTFTYDRFTVNGAENLLELFNFRNAAQTVTTSRTVKSYAYRVNDYDRTTNTVEGDYQYHDVFAFHIGWRYSKRQTDVSGTEGSVTTNFVTPGTQPTPSVSYLNIAESEENSTNTFLAGMKIKPTKGWVIFWDMEHGTADNVFSRLENYDFTNFRARSRWTHKTVTANAYAIIRNNNNPSQTYDNPPLPFGTDIKNRTYGGDLSWSPNDRFSVTGGYVYRNQTAKTPVYIWIGSGSGVKTLGLSEFYVRDRYGYVEVSAKPHKRLSFFGTYRFNKDNGQGSIPDPPVGSANIVDSYPMHLNSPEFRAAIRLTRNIDWNIGYQYYDYEDVKAPTQNYKAHLPYTSLRIYFGGGVADR